MKTKQGSVLQSLRAVQAFLDAHGDQLGDVNRTGARQRLDAYIVELDGHAETQTGSQLIGMGLTQRQYALRRALLRDHMFVISRIARAKLVSAPELAPFRVPRGRPTVERICAVAAGMAKAAEPIASVFIADGMPVDFVARLDRAAAAVVAALSDRTQAHGARRGATRGLQVTLSEGRKAVHVLDAFVQSALYDDPSLLANWNVVKRVRITPAHATALAPPAPAAVETLVA